MAIRTHPSYAIAHENLGDIYARMANQSYARAQQLEPDNAQLGPKMALVRDVFNVGAKPAKPAAKK